MGPKLWAFLITIMALSSAACILSSCNKASNPGVPIYVRIDSPTVLSNGFFGSASSRIPSVWATTGAHDLGA